MFVCEKNYTCCDHQYWDKWEDVEQEAIECGHLIEVAPVVHGKWEECDWVEYDYRDECEHYPHEGCVCTNCRNAFKKEFVLSPRVDLCPHCGARMDGE